MRFLIEIHGLIPVTITPQPEPGATSGPQDEPEPGPGDEAALRSTFEALIEEAIRIVETMSGVEFEHAVDGFAARLGRELLLPASVPFEVGHNLGAVRMVTTTANGTDVQCDHGRLWLARGSAAQVANYEPKAGNGGPH